MASLTRRLALKLLGLSSAWLGHGRVAFGQSPSNKKRDVPLEPSTTVSWNNTHDRVWIGADIWSNPMEDWAGVIHQQENRGENLLR